MFNSQEVVNTLQAFATIRWNPAAGDGFRRAIVPQDYCILAILKRRNAHVTCSRKFLNVSVKSIVCVQSLQSGLLRITTGHASIKSPHLGVVAVSFIIFCSLASTFAQLSLKSRICQNFSQLPVHSRCLHLRPASSSARTRR